MGTFLGALSIIWGILIVIAFYRKLNNYDFRAYREKSRQFTDKEMPLIPLLAIADWLFRKTPVVIIKGAVLAVGFIFIVGGFVGIITTKWI